MKSAVDSANKNLEGLKATKTGDLVVLLIRPQEAVAAVQALGQAYSDYYGAINDYDRAQFRLYRSLGQPPQEVFEGRGDGECRPALPGRGEPPVATQSATFPLSAPLRRRYGEGRGFRHLPCLQQGAVMSDKVNPPATTNASLSERSKPKNP